MQHETDSCNSPHPDVEIFQVRIEQTGDRFEIQGPFQLVGLQDVTFPAIQGTVNGSQLEWSATGTSSAGGCSITAQFAGVGVITRTSDSDVFNLLRGSAQVTLSKTPGSCEVPGYCEDALYATLFFR